MQDFYAEILFQLHWIKFEKTEAYYEMIKIFKDANSSKITNSLYIIPLDTQNSEYIRIF